MGEVNLTIYQAYLPADDPEAARRFYCDILGFELRGDVGKGALRWLTVGPPGQPGTSIVLTPPGVDPSISDEERRVIIDMMAKGTYGAINLATPSVDVTFAPMLMLMIWRHSLPLHGREINPEAYLRTHYEFLLRALLVRPT